MYVKAHSWTGAVDLIVCICYVLRTRYDDRSDNIYKSDSFKLEFCELALG